MQQQQQITVEDSVRSKMEELRLVCDREIPIHQQRMEAALLSYRNSLESSKTKTQQTLQNQVKLGKLKAQLREAEDGLVKALAVKTRKEAKRIATLESIAAMKARVEEIKRVVEGRRAKKDEYAAIISQQSEALVACEEKRDKDTEHRGEIEEAISWYNRVLGLRIECGHGIKFIFNNISLKNPKEEYSFTIRHESDHYTLLGCDPHLNDTKELIHELNKTNGLFKFVRTMREKFQEAAACGASSSGTSFNPDYSTISASGPVSSVSTDCGTESLANRDEIRPVKAYTPSRKANRGRGIKQALRSPGSASSLRRSPRFKKQ